MEAAKKSTGTSTSSVLQYVQVVLPGTSIAFYHDRWP